MENHKRSLVSVGLRILYSEYVFLFVGDYLDFPKFLFVQLIFCTWMHVSNYNFTNRNLNGGKEAVSFFSIDTQLLYT